MSKPTSNCFACKYCQEIDIEGLGYLLYCGLHKEDIHGTLGWCEDYINCDGTRRI